MEKIMIIYFILISVFSFFSGVIITNIHYNTCFFGHHPKNNNDISTGKVMRGYGTCNRKMQYVSYTQTCKRCGKKIGVIEYADGETRYVSANFLKGIN